MQTAEGFLALEHPAARLTLDPARGGAIRQLSWHGRPVLRQTPAHSGDDPFDMACFPMIPYVNRIAHGRFTFAGRTVQLRQNWVRDPHPLHGQGWRAPWSVVESSAAAAVLRFTGGADEWPWPYESEQRFQLLADGLLLELSVRNLGRDPMPAMLGMHPYFPRAGGATLEARLPRVWLTDSAALPVEEVPTPTRWCLDAPRAVDALALDHCFSGWDGLATLRWPDLSLTLRATHCAFLHVYAPPGRDFFCIEPQSAAAGALGRGAHEVNIVAPGERFSIQVRLQLEGG